MITWKCPAFNLFDIRALKGKLVFYTSHKNRALSDLCCPNCGIASILCVNFKWGSNKYSVTPLYIIKPNSDACLPYISYNDILYSDHGVSWQHFSPSCSSAVWAFMWFVSFCFLTNQWQVSNPDDNPLNEGADAARAAITFSFFSIFTWVSTAIYTSSDSKL